MNDQPNVVVPIRWVKPDLTQLNEITYVLHGTDESTKQVGYFFYDDEMYQRGCGTWAISPVFPYIEDMYSWAKGQGFKYHCSNVSFTMCRTFPTSLRIEP